MSKAEEEKDVWKSEAKKAIDEVLGNIVDAEIALTELIDSLYGLHANEVVDFNTQLYLLEYLARIKKMLNEFFFEIDSVARAKVGEEK
jgi:hypothetical protein